MAKAGVFNPSPKQKHALSKLPPGMRAAKLAEYKRQAAGVKTPAGRSSAKKPIRQQNQRKGGASALTSLFGAGHYNAFHRAPQAIARAVGHATVVRGFSRGTTATMPDDANYQIAIFTMNTNKYVGVWANVKEGTDGKTFKVPTEDANYFTIPNTELGQSGGPTNTLFGKFSVRLRNTSKAMDAGGSVYVLALDGPAKLENVTENWTARGGWNALMDYVLGCPKTRVFSGAELLKTRQWNTHPIDAARALEFHDCDQTKGTVDELKWWQEHPVYSQLVFVFQKPAGGQNTYEFSMANQHFCRYEVGGVLANQAESVPTAPINVIDGARKMMEEVGSAGHLAQDVIGTLSAFKTAF